MTQFTHTDIDVGVRLVEALVQQARSLRGMPIVYGDLLTLARSLHPKQAMLARAVPVGIGPKLQFVQDFCAAHGYPNLASLAVSKATQQPMPGLLGDWEGEKRAVAAFDWAVADAPLAAYAARARAAVPARFKPRKERPADVSWYAYYCSHRAACEQVTPEDKQEIVNLIMAGLDPETALGRVLGAKADFGNEA